MAPVFERTHVLDDALFAQMFEERKRVFIDLLGWDLLAIEDRFEVDQFDGPSTRYLICADQSGRHLGSLRLLPCDRPYLLGTVFPQLCEDAPPREADIWEISRLCLAPGIGAGHRRAVRDRLANSLVAMALREDICAFCCIADDNWSRQIESFGWRCEKLGVPQRFGHGHIEALKISIDQSTPHALRAAGIQCDPTDFVRAVTI